MPVVRVSVYLPWRPADVYCDGVEYSSYQYGLHQYWISHSGLAACPPAAYSNIVSRIVIIGAELWPSSLTSYRIFSKKTTKKIIFASISPHKSDRFHFFQRMSNLDHCEVERKRQWVQRAPASLVQREKKEDGKMMESKNPTKAKIRHESVPWSLIHGVLLFFSSPFLSFTLTHTLGSQGNWCAAFDGKERPILTAKKTMMKGLKKERKWVENVLLERMATHVKSLGWSDGNQTSGRWGFDGLTAAEERLR